jgi:hypothetical protein
MDFDDLKLAIESQYGGTAARIQSVPVVEKCEGKTVWDGTVHVFALSGHPSATIAYAWSSPIEGSDKRRYFAALQMGGITDPQAAVRNNIAELRAQRRSANSN